MCSHVNRITIYIYILYFTSTCKLKLALALLGSLEIKSYLNLMPNDQKKNSFLSTSDPLLTAPQYEYLTHLYAL